MKNSSFFSFITSGSQFTGSSSAINNPYAFQGRQYDKESGLYYFRNRYYSPDLGRFISRDPLGYAAGDINLYRFVGNGPYGGLDPMGLAEIKKRPLDFCPLLGNSPILDFLDAEVLHEQIFFQDSIGGNIGFFQDISDTPSTLGVIRPDKTENLSTYYESTTQGGFDDCVMRLAVDATPEQNYSLLGIGRLEKFNCQDWVSNVKAKYYELEKLDWVNVTHIIDIVSFPKLLIV